MYTAVDANRTTVLKSGILIDAVLGDLRRLLKASSGPHTSEKSRIDAHTRRNIDAAARTVKIPALLSISRVPFECV